MPLLQWVGGARRGLKRARWDRRKRSKQGRESGSKHTELRHGYMDSCCLSRHWCVVPVIESLWVQDKVRSLGHLSDVKKRRLKVVKINMRLHCVFTHSCWQCHCLFLWKKKSPDLRICSCSSILTIALWLCLYQILEYVLWIVSWGKDNLFMNSGNYATS